MASIEFNSEKIKFKLPNQRKTSRWLAEICKKEKKRLGSITYVFCSDAFLLGLNRKFLHHSTYTDILSFDYSEGTSIEGEIYISVPRVRENAKAYGQPFLTEIHRVMAHGLLHFLGYQDKTARQKTQMRKKEEACLSLRD